MKVFLKTLTLMGGLLLCNFIHGQEDGVLWWMFDETSLIQEIGGDSIPIQNLVGRGDAEGLGVNGIRVAAYDGDTLLGYLSIDDGFGEKMDYYPMPSLDFDSGTDSWNAGPTYAEYGSLRNNPAAMFVIELGNWNGNDNTWKILAHSDYEHYDALRKFTDVSDFEMHTTLEWTGGSYSVPEPSSGILLLIGTVPLLLKRKSRKT